MRKNKDLFSIFPADAGVNLICMGGASCSGDIPRGCGGEPVQRFPSVCPCEYSPRMRG